MRRKFDCALECEKHYKWVCRAGESKIWAMHTRCTHRICLHIQRGLSTWQPLPVYICACIDANANNFVLSGSFQKEQCKIMVMGAELVLVFGYVPLSLMSVFLFRNCHIFYFIWLLALPLHSFRIVYCKTKQQKKKHASNSLGVLRSRPLWPNSTVKPSLCLS